MILPSSTERVIPSWFTRSLADLDPNLICYFNPLRHRWIIDRCTRNGEMLAAAHPHTAECPRTNVMVVQDEKKQYMPLCEEVIQSLRSKDTWTQFGNAENYARHTQAVSDAIEAANEKAVADLYREASQDNKRQLNEAYTIHQTHDLARPHS